MSKILVTAVVLSGGLLVGACAREPENPFPEGTNILLITVDTLRADHLSSYGYPRQTSPVIDRVASEGVRFDQATVQWPKTGPSFASIFTSTYPKDNGIVRRIGQPLPHEFLMLAEVLRRHGYSTQAVVANGAVGSDFNFDQGFEKYIETWKQPAGAKRAHRNDSAAVNFWARQVIDDIDRSRPFFLWIHYLDPHSPYAPPPGWKKRYLDDEWFDPTKKLDIDWEKEIRELGGIGRSRVLNGRDQLDFYIARYDAEIAFTDTQIGSLLRYLETHDLLRQTLTVLTSDHGESLGEHDYYFDHGRFSFQTCLRVPLVFHYPGVLPPGVDAEPVELIHLMPTLLQAAGVKLEGGVWMQGRSLSARLLEPERNTSEPVYARSEAGYGTKGKWQKVMRDQRYKLIFAPYGGDQRWITGALGVEYALFDLENDPGETENVADEFPEEFGRLKDELHRWWKPNQFDVLVDDPVPGEQKEMSDETEEQLRALGYLQ